MYRSEVRDDTQYAVDILSMGGTSRLVAGSTSLPGDIVGTDRVVRVHRPAGGLCCFDCFLILLRIVTT